MMLREVRSSSLLGRVIGCSRGDSIIVTSEFGVSCYNEQLLLEKSWTIPQRVQIPAVSNGQRFAAVTESCELLVWGMEESPAVFADLSADATFVAISEEIVGAVYSDNTIVFFHGTSSRNVLRVIESDVVCFVYYDGLFRAVCGRFVKTWRLQKEKRHMRIRAEKSLNFDHIPSSACFCADQAHAVTLGEWRGQAVDRLIYLDSNFFGCIVSGKGLQVWKQDSLILTIPTIEVNPGGFIITDGFVRVIDLASIQKSALFSNNVTRLSRKRKITFELNVRETVSVWCCDHPKHTIENSIMELLWKCQERHRLVAILKKRLTTCGDLDIHDASLLLKRYLTTSESNVRFAKQCTHDCETLTSSLKPVLRKLKNLGNGHSKLAADEDFVEGPAFAP